MAAVAYLTWVRYGELRKPAPVPVQAIAPLVEPAAVEESTAPVNGFPVEGIVVSTEAAVTPGQSPAVSTVSTVPISTSTVETAPPITTSTSPVQNAAPGMPSQAARRTFKYFNKAAKKVHLVGDFNKWVPQAFQRNSRGGWSVSLSLSPGDYSYNFVVDGRTIRDPNQQRTDSRGRSLLTVPSPVP